MLFRSAVLKAYHGYDAEANTLLESCGGEPDEAVFYQYRAARTGCAPYRAGVGRSPRDRRTNESILADLNRAKSIEDSWRLGRQFIEYYESKKDFAKVLETTTEYLKTWPERDPIRLAHANALLQLKRYRECIAYLETVNLLPSEHRGNAADIWHAAQDALGIKRTWPENLGKGEPYKDVK